MKRLIAYAVVATSSLTSACADEQSASAQPGSNHYRVVARIAGPDGPWDFSTVDSMHGRLFVARGNGVMAVDLKSGTVTPVFAPGARVHDVVLFGGNSKLLSTNGESDTASLIDTQSGAVEATIATGSKPDAAILDPSSGLIYVMNAKSGDATIIDPKAKKAIGTIAIGGALEFAAVDGAGRMYVNVEDKGEIAVVDLTKRSVVAHYKLDGCDSPSGLVYIAATHVLIAACGNGVAKAVDARTGGELASLPIGPRPDDVLYDERRGLAFVPSGGDGKLTVIAVGDPAHIAVVDSVATQTGARIGALDSATGRIYLPAAKYTPPSTPDGRPAAIPGTFEILVLEPH
jgi:YVTN family beta-propeller protein